MPSDPASSRESLPDREEVTASDGAEPLTHQPPRRIAPAPQLSSRGLLLALLMVCLLPLAGLSLYAIFYGSAADRPLPVGVKLERRPVQAADGQGAMLADVVVIENLADHDIPQLTADLNGQYFLYQDAPLKEGETLVVLQSAFATKSNQRFEPGSYPITEVNVTGRLPSGARGVAEFEFD